MAQGKQKFKSSRPGSQKQHRQHHGKSGPKKGGRIIAPKKAQVIQQQKVKKNLEIAIRKKIEQDVTMKAAANMPKKLGIVKPPEAASSNKKASK